MGRTVSIAALRMSVTVLLAVTFVFVILRVSGDPVRAMISPDAPEEIVNHLRTEWGLDQPLHVQFARYVGHLLQRGFRPLAERRSCRRSKWSSRRCPRRCC